MRGLYVGLSKVRRALSVRAGMMIEQRLSYIQCKAPKDNISTWESAFALTAITLGVLGPAGWILAHLDDYKARG